MFYPPLPIPTRRVNAESRFGFRTRTPRSHMATHVQQLCPCATPFGEPCANFCKRPHPYMPELRCCFDCEKLLTVMRETARLSTEGLPLVSADRVKTNFQLPADLQFPVGSVGGMARETLCALCTQPANGDEPMLECFGSRDSAACKLVWHALCHVATSDAAVPSHGGVFRCCTCWPDRAKLDPKDRFREPHTHYRKRLARPGSLGSKSAARGAAAKASTAAADDASTAAAANAPVLDVAAQPPATPAPSSSAPPAEVTPPTMVPPTSPVTPHMSSRAEPAGSNDTDDRAHGGPTGKPRRSLSNQTKDAAAVGGAMGGAGASASAGAGAGTGSVVDGAGAAVPGAAQPSQCERDAQCTRGFRHGGKGGKCSLRPRLPAAADAPLAPKSKGRVCGPPADVGGIDWSNTEVDASCILDNDGAQCCVFLAAVSAARFGSFGHVLWLPDKDGAAVAPGQKLAVKTPRPVTEPEGDDESAMKKRVKAQARADTRLHWEARATPSSAHTQHRCRVVRRHTHLLRSLHPTSDMAGTHPQATAARAQHCAAARV